MGNHSTFCRFEVERNALLAAIVVGVGKAKTVHYRRLVA
jgi:hypothetical protein